MSKKILFLCHDLTTRLQLSATWSAAGDVHAKCAPARVAAHFVSSGMTLFSHSAAQQRDVTPSGGTWISREERLKYTLAR